MIKPLALPNDAAIALPTIDEYLSYWAGTDRRRSGLSTLISVIARASQPLATRLSLGSIPGDPTALVGINDSGDRQKALDLAAHHHLLSALGQASVRAVLSEEADEVILLSEDGLFDVAIDPIDGSGSIGIGAPLGLLFAVFPAGPSFLRSGREIVAAGYVSFGHSVDFGFSLGEGVAFATLDAGEGVFRVTDTQEALHEETSMIAFNASNLRHWAPGLQRYVADLTAGQEGPRERDFNMRWLAAAVGELHRILRQGGVFLYPSDRRAGYEQGQLRLLYEAYPIAWLMEQAGGSAIDGTRAILDQTAKSLHQKTPLIFGARNEVDVVKRYLED